MKIFITGINSFIGQNLARIFLQNQHEVVGTYRSQALGIPQVTEYLWKTGMPFNAEWFESCDILIHLAWNLEKGHVEENVKSTEEIFSKWNEKINKQSYFFSTCSAHKGALSEYGKSKYLAELSLKNKKTYIIRPGWVIGQKSSFDRTINLIKKTPVMPLIDGGNQVVPLIGLKDLSQIMLELVSMKSSQKELNLFYPDRFSMKFLLNETAKVLNRKVFFIPISISILIRVVKFIHFFKIPFPVKLEQLEGYRANNDLFFESDVSQFLKTKKKLKFILEENLYESE